MYPQLPLAKHYNSKDRLLMKNPMEKFHKVTP